MLQFMSVMHGSAVIAIAVKFSVCQLRKYRKPVPIKGQGAVDVSPKGFASVYIRRMII
jgi:hypothetical protein